jgi:MFS family permease
VGRPADERARLIRRATLLLAAAQAALWGAIGALATFGPLASVDLSHRESTAPVLFGVYFLAVAAGARLGGRAMDRRGRRIGLAAGYVLLGVGALVAATAIFAGSLAWLLAAGALIGGGVGPAQLGRAAVADMHPPARRGQAVGTVVLAGTIGAVGGPPLAGAARALAEGAGWSHPGVAPWLLIPLLAPGGAGVRAGPRPDPRSLAVGGPAAGGRSRSSAVAQAWWRWRRWPSARR